MRDGLWRSPGRGAGTALCSESAAGITDRTVGELVTLSRLCQLLLHPEATVPQKGAKGAASKAARCGAMGWQSWLCHSPPAAGAKPTLGLSPSPAQAATGSSRVQLLLGEVQVERSSAHGLLRHPRAAHSSHVVIQAAQAAGELCGEGDQRCVVRHLMKPGVVYWMHHLLVLPLLTHHLSFLTMLFLSCTALPRTRCVSDLRAGTLGTGDVFPAAQLVQCVLSSLGVASCTASWERAVTGSCLAHFRVSELPYHSGPIPCLLLPLPLPPAQSSTAATHSWRPSCHTPPPIPDRTWNTTAVRSSFVSICTSRLRL